MQQKNSKQILVFYIDAFESYKFLNLMFHLREIEKTQLDILINLNFNELKAKTKSSLFYANLVVKIL